MRWGGDWTDCTVTKSSGIFEWNHGVRWYPKSIWNRTILEWEMYLYIWYGWTIDEWIKWVSQNVEYGYRFQNVEMVFPLSFIVHNCTEWVSVVYRQYKEQQNKWSRWMRFVRITALYYVLFVEIVYYFEG